MREVSLLALILMLSAVLQTAAAFIAVRQVSSVDKHYRMAWLVVALALVLMVERRVLPLWRHVQTGEISSLTDALFGMAISVLMVAGVYGVTELLTGLRSRANTDELTGLLNRRAVLQTVHSEIERARRTQHSIAFLMYDLDHFKDVNDRFGHQAGDQVLQKVARTIKAILRESDIVCRWGGEEFLVVVKGAAPDHGAPLAEKIRRAVEGEDFSYRKTQIRITISLGIAGARTGESTDRLIARADKALYRAKETGRNRVCSADELADTTMPG
jgi:diguanylate cyclase (GGDEF)-like protein